MSVTGQQVINQLDDVFDDAGNGKWTAARKLGFVNAAIDAAFGYGIKDKRIDSTVTLASGTFEYSPTATPELEDGYAAAYVTPLSTAVEPKVRLHRVWQRLSVATWTVLLPNETVSKYDGKTLHLHYNSRVARIAAAADSIELPMDYLWQYAALIACTAGSASGANFNARPFESLIPVWMQNVTRLAAASQRGFITKLPVVYESGRTAHVDPNAGVYRV